MYIIKMISSNCPNVKNYDIDSLMIFSQLIVQI